MTPEERAELLASEIGDTALGFPADIAAIATAIREAIAAEREACAKVADDNRIEKPGTKYGEGCDYTAKHIAIAIRARKGG